jgi:hypothetical protein
MAEKRVTIEISNKAKKSKYPMQQIVNCSMRNLPTPGEYKIYECTVILYNDVRLTKSLIITALKNGEWGIDEVFGIECVYLNYLTICWVKDQGCFKYNVVAITDM